VRVSASTLWTVLSAVNEACRVSTPKQLELMSICRTILPARPRYVCGRCRRCAASASPRVLVMSPVVGGSMRATDQRVAQVCVPPSQNLPPRQFPCTKVTEHLNGKRNGKEARPPPQHPPLPWPRHTLTAHTHHNEPRQPKEHPRVYSNCLFCVSLRHRLLTLCADSSRPKSKSVCGVGRTSSRSSETLDPRTSSTTGAETAARR
jgi:hypothetical protein